MTDLTLRTIDAPAEQRQGSVPRSADPSADFQAALQVSLSQDRELAALEQSTDGAEADGADQSSAEDVTFAGPK